jgi:hypothetical protein
MTQDRQKDIEKDLLWDYMEAKKQIVAFKADFGKLAEDLSRLSQGLLKNPEALDDPDGIRVLAERITGLADTAKEYRELLDRNAERRHQLIQMGTLDGSE